MGAPLFAGNLRYGSEPKNIGHRHDDLKFPDHLPAPHQAEKNTQAFQNTTQFHPLLSENRF
jgi:hypothetical protein